VRTTASASDQEGLDRENGRGTLKQRRETWFNGSNESRPWSHSPSPIDGQREEATWKDTETGEQQPADIRRLNNDKHEQADKRQGSNQLEEATNHERTEVRQETNKKVICDIQEYMAARIAAHASPPN
jgi:hypothetical protein